MSKEEREKYFESEVRKALISVLGRNKGEDACSSADLLSEGYIDSFGLVELASHLEVACDIVIPVDKTTPENFRSLKLLAALCFSLSNSKRDD